MKDETSAPGIDAAPKPPSPNDRELQRGYLPQLDGLRALAVIGVAVFHARSQWFPGGFIGVDIFFVLSGFLITRIALSELRKTGRLSLKRFYVRRALRLFPALFFACFVLALLYWAIPVLPQSPETLVGILGAVTYSSTWLVAFGIADLGAMLPTWSLAVEEHFYLVWPVLLILAFRTGRWMRASIVGITVLAIAYRLAAYFVFEWEVARIHYAPDTRAEQLLIGCALAVVLPGISRKIPSVAAWIAGSVLFLYMIFSAMIPVDLYHAGGSTVVGLLTAVIVAHLVTTEHGLLSRLLATPSMVWIGQRSYGIYLWNLPLIALFSFLGPGVVAVLVKIAICFIVPALSFAFVEKPFLRMKDRFEARPGNVLPEARIAQADPH